MSVPMRIVLVTDAWKPQVNGVVRTLTTTAAELERMGNSVMIVSPENRATIPCPSYPEIRLTLRPGRAIRAALHNAAFDAIHVATEGPLGWAARHWCIQHGIAFTSSYHTRFPEYLRARAPVPLTAGHALMRRFHSAAERTLVRTPSQQRHLAGHGFTNLAIWPGAVDTALFCPRLRDALNLPRPIALYAGRIAPEKNPEAFLALDLPGSKVVVGGGPALERLRLRFPEVHFLGYRHGEALAETLATADVFVFPSRTDTLGLVMLEAMACGVPVAAYPVPGPLDLVRDGANGALDEDLREAVFRALAVAREDCVEFAQAFSWRRATRRFVELLVPAKAPAGGSSGSPAYNPGSCPSALPAPKRMSTSPAN